ncbi:MAG: hypothetical protein Q4E13_15455 [Clostridia bacterium]|nr:hypothetical protein [Clostridia bacterium]
MRTFRMASKVCQHNLRKLICSPRFTLGIVVLLCLQAFQVLPELRRFCTDRGVGAAPIPLYLNLTNERFPVTVCYFCWILWMCDAPFIDSLQPYLMLRAGRQRWTWGNLFYILVSAVLFWTCVWGVCIVAMGGKIDWTMDWGPVYRYIVSVEHLSSLKVSDVLIQKFSPIQLLGLSFGLKVMCSVFLAELMYLVNFLTRNHYGMIAAAILLLFHGHFYDWFAGSDLYYVSPISLSTLNCIDIVEMGMRPSVAYAVGALLSLCILCTALCFWVVQGRAIQVYKSI